MKQKQVNQGVNLYDFSNKVDNFEDENAKRREREKRIRSRNIQKKDQFDLDTETVIGMTNRNNQNKNQLNREKISKKQAKMLRKRKKIKKLLKLLLLICIVIGGIIFALVSPLFNITKIEVIGNEQIATETIISLSQISVGQNVFKYNRKNVEKEIKTNPYVDTVSIKRKIPNKVEITISEREKNFNIEFLNGFAVINNQGYILQILENKIEELPTLQGLSTEEEQIVEGNRLNAQDLEKLETVIQIINICKSYELDTKVSAIDISNKNNYIIYMDKEKKTIYLGDNSNLNNKMLYVPPILQANEGIEGTIYLNGDINNNFNPRFREKV